MDFGLTIWKCKPVSFQKLALGGESLLVDLSNIKLFKNIRFFTHVASLSSFKVSLTHLSFRF